MPPKPPLSLLVRHRLTENNKLPKLFNSPMRNAKLPLLAISPKPLSSLSSISSNISSTSSTALHSLHKPTHLSSSKLKKDIHAPDHSYSINYPIQIVPTDVLALAPAEQLTQVPMPAQIEMKKYATSVDPRNFLTTYEYEVNGHHIIWDYHTGYVHLTGLWKAIGNNKADIVKLVENEPQLEPVIRRVRGGYLKIQGTWVPFDIAKALASRTCYHIRYALVPLFGAEFPSTCLQPGDPGFGILQLRVIERTRRRSRKRSFHDTTLPYSRPSHSLKKRTKSESQGPRPFSPDRTPPLTYASPRAQPTSMESATSPHSLPRLSLSESVSDYDEPAELFQILQATQSLQQMASSRSSFRPPIATPFSQLFANERVWRWDGHERLNVRENENRVVVLPPLGSAPSSTSSSALMTPTRIEINHLLC